MKDQLSHIRCTLFCIAGLWLVLCLPSQSFAGPATSCEQMVGSDNTGWLLPDAIASDCGTYVDEAGQGARYCQWKFDYRSDAARSAYRSTKADLEKCHPIQASEQAEVNHPDSYDQVFFIAGDHVISLALKDKASHAASYLFLRVEHAR